MQDPQNREVMAALYRILEKYEMPRECNSDEEIIKYFDEVRADCQKFYTEYWEKSRNWYARHLSTALYAAISDRFKEAHDRREHRDGQTQKTVYQ